MPNVSGGFGLFDRSVAIAAGGYDGTSFAEDMDLITRMVGYSATSPVLIRLFRFLILAVGRKDLPTWRCFTVNVPVGHEDCSRHLVSTIDDFQENI